MAMNRARVRQLLGDFKFQSLFVQEMGWNSVPDGRSLPIGDSGYMRRLIAQMSGVTVLEVFPTVPDGTLPDKDTSNKIHTAIEKLSYENVLIFLDEDSNRSKSMMYWVKREDKKRRPRRHHYFKGQPGDLFMSKIDGMVIDMDELLPDGSIPISRVTSRLAAALDIEKVTKKFYNEFSGLRLKFIDLIEGIPNDADRYWYASVLLNRLMFIYFLQKKGFIQNNTQYLDGKLKESQGRGPDRYYTEFLDALFFEGFAKPEHERSAEAKSLLGPIPYLNGGLFIRHKLELDYGAIYIPDKAFENVLSLFGRYSWHLDDTPGARDNEINPDVLGYIFEKYINQKAFGAYYTRSEITEYLCDRSIHSVILQRVNQHSTRQFDDLSDVLMRLDADLCRILLDVLPKLSILDPACGSGAFLVAAMKNLLNIYGVVYGKIRVLNDTNLLEHLTKIERDHPFPYYIRKRIITDNLYGVDIMDEATEIAKLRLFLALVSSAQKLDDLEPLPNIDFNIMAGNSLIGLLSVDGKRFDDSVQMEDMMQRFKAQDYRRALAEKNRLIALYRDTDSDYSDYLQSLRQNINTQRNEAHDVLNEILLDNFRSLKIQYEQVQLTGKATKRQLQTEDIEAQTPFHWGYEFDEIIETRGGFDVIITNPPWEVFQVYEKEFFQQFDPAIQKKKLKPDEWTTLKETLLERGDIQRAWLEFQSGFHHVKRFFKTSPQYRNSESGKVNLYKLFTEQCINLLRAGGTCGIVIPSGIYISKDSKQLRQLLFADTAVTGLFGFENRKAIFEGVHKSFKFVVLTFEKGGHTERFPAAFMRHDVKELEQFPSDDSLAIAVGFIKRTSPATLSITEFKNQSDIDITEKMLFFPLLGENPDVSWNAKLITEFDTGAARPLYQLNPGPGLLPLYQGHMMWQFKHDYATPRYWIDETVGRQWILGKYGQDHGQVLDYQNYRFSHRRLARSTDKRTFIATILPRRVFASDSLYVSSEPSELSTLLVLTALANSHMCDWLLRKKVDTTINMNFVFQLPVPRLTHGDPYFDSIVNRTAQLICTAPEYDDLAAEVGLGGHHNGVTDPAGRAKLRAELDGIMAHIYGLTEDEFAYVLTTFPLVAEPVKVAALNAYRDVERGKVY